MLQAAFQRLPIEVNASIAGYLDDGDLCRFTLTCRDAHAAVNCQASPAWRELFLSAFDLHPGISNDKLKTVYQVRKKWLSRGTGSTFFRSGRSSNEQDCLRVLRSLINESFVGLREPGDCRLSLNVEKLSRFMDNSKILDHFLDPRALRKINPLLLVIQVMMIHFQLNRTTFKTTLNFHVSQKAVYSSVQSEPMFYGPNQIEINMPLVAHTLNFFKHHMTHPEEGLYHTYTASPSTKVKPWRKRLINGAQTLGKKWAGVYAYLNHAEISTLRRSAAGEHLLLDNLNSEDQGGELQTLELHFPDSPTQWPTIFERHLQSLTHPSATYLSDVNMNAARKFAKSSSRTRAQHRHYNSPSPSITTPSTSTSTSNTNTATTPTDDPIDPRALSFAFTGTGHDAEDFYAAGWLNPLPAQHGIPGWQRMTMMKFFVAEGAEDDVLGSSSKAEASVKTSIETGGAKETETEGRGEGEGDGKGEGESAAGEFNISAALRVMDESSLWAYEGVVLPGGEIVVGRWWSPSALTQGAGNQQQVEEEEEGEYSGPFMFWCVD